jgi:hypothetical protein
LLATEGRAISEPLSMGNVYTIHYPSDEEQEEEIDTGRVV